MEGELIFRVTTGCLEPGLLSVWISLTYGVIWNSFMAWPDIFSGVKTSQSPRSTSSVWLRPYTYKLALEVSAGQSGSVVRDSSTVAVDRKSFVPADGVSVDQEVVRHSGDVRPRHVTTDHVRYDHIRPELWTPSADLLSSPNAESSDVKDSRPEFWPRPRVFGLGLVNLASKNVLSNAKQYCIGCVHFVVKKVKVHTLDIAPLRSESPPQKRSGMAHVHKGFHSSTCTPTRSSAIGMSHTCPCLPSRSWYSFTDPGGMEGWVDLGAK